MLTVQNVRIIQNWGGGKRGQGSASPRFLRDAKLHTASLRLLSVLSFTSQRSQVTSTVSVSPLQLCPGLLNQCPVISGMRDMRLADII